MKKMARTKKVKEPTIEEQIKTIQEHYGQYNRHVRRMWGKLVGYNKLIRGTSVPFKKDEYEAVELPKKENANCKGLLNECKNLRRDASAFCQECSKKYHADRNL